MEFAQLKDEYERMKEEQIKATETDHKSSKEYEEQIAILQVLNYAHVLVKV